MAENIVIRPTGEIEPRPCRQEIETGLRQFGSAFALKPFRQAIPQGMQIADVGRGIVALRLIELARPPVARLLLFRNLLAEHLAHKILQTMPVGIGAHELAGDLGAEHRRSRYSEIVFDRGKIEAGEVVEFHPRRVGKHGLEVRCVERTARRETDEVLVAPAVGDLDEAQSIAWCNQPHRFGIDRYSAGTKHTFGEIFFMEMDSHTVAVLRLCTPVRQWAGKRSQTMNESAVQTGVPESWRSVLAPVLATREARKLGGFLQAQEKAGRRIFPPRGCRLRALELTPLDKVKAVILGQDPYHGAGQAHGLAFSVPQGVKVPPSLVNIYKELASDLGIAAPGHGNLESWARQGVLLLNNALTVEEGQAGAHQGLGWEAVTDAVVAAVAARQEPVVFMLWGSHARKKAERVPGLASSAHLVLTAPHPSPLSAHSGFFGCHHFSKANAFLEANGRGAIDWAA